MGSSGAGSRAPSKSLNLHSSTALADAGATDLGVGLFSSPTVREGQGF